MFVPPVLFVLPLFFPKLIPIGTTIISSSSSSNPTILSTLTVLAGHMDSLGTIAGTGGSDIFLLLGIGGGGLGIFLSVTSTFLSQISLQNVCKR